MASAHGLPATVRIGRSLPVTTDGNRPNVDSLLTGKSALRSVDRRYPSVINHMGAAMINIAVLCVAVAAFTP
jgi:hypothetical protein